MLSREEYDRIIKMFLVGLNHRCLDTSEQELHALPRMGREVESCLREFRDPENDAGQLLYHAFVYLDEYIDADWDRVVSAGYEAYQIAESKGDGGGIDA